MRSIEHFIAWKTIGPCNCSEYLRSPKQAARHVFTSQNQIMRRRVQKFFKRCSWNDVKWDIYVYLTRVRSMWGTWPILLDSWENADSKYIFSFCPRAMVLKGNKASSENQILKFCSQLWPRFSRIPDLEGKNWIYIWNQRDFSFPMV